MYLSSADFRFKAAQAAALGKELDLSEVRLLKDYTPQLKIVDPDDDHVMEFVASTPDVDRDGDTIDVAGWELDNFLKAGSFLWAHNSTLPGLAEVITAYKMGNELRVRVRFTGPDMPHPMGYGFGHTVWRMYQEKVIKGVSVGFLPKEWTYNEERGGWLPTDFKRQELLELSAVPVPSNPNAIEAAKSKGIDLGPVVNWAEAFRDQSGGHVPGLDEKVQAFLDQAAKTSVQVLARDAEGLFFSAKTEGVAMVDKKEAPKSEGAGVFNDQLKAAIQQAETLEGRALDEALALVETIHIRGRALSTANEAKLQQLVKFLPPIEVKTEDLEVVEETVDENLISKEDLDFALKAHTENLFKQLTGRVD